MVAGDQAARSLRSLEQLRFDNSALARLPCWHSVEQRSLPGRRRTMQWLHRLLARRLRRRRRCCPSPAADAGIAAARCCGTSRDGPKHLIARFTALQRPPSPARGKKEPPRRAPERERSGRAAPAPPTPPGPNFLEFSNFCIQFFVCSVLISHLRVLKLEDQFAPQP